jgi:hypothetical protein
LNSFWHRIEVLLPEGPMGLALDAMTGNVITRTLFFRISFLCSSYFFFSVLSHKSFLLKCYFYTAKTGVKEKSPSDMVGITSGCLLTEINGLDLSELDYKGTIKALKDATKPVTLTLKSKQLLEAKIEEHQVSRAPTKPLTNERPASNEFEVKLRNTSKKDMVVIKSGSDFIIKMVMPQNAIVWTVVV